MTHPHERLEKNLRKAAQGALSADERERMRSMLLEYASMKPVRAAIAPRSAVLPRFYLAMRIGFVAMLVLAVGSSSVAYAAEGTLPGDLLYPVKVDVTEPIRTALQTTPAEKATWEMTLATRRIDEATALAAKGALSTSTETSLAARFEANAAAADAAEAEVGTSSPDEAGVARATFAVRLSAYRDVLARLDAERHATSTESFQAALDAHIASRGASVLRTGAPAVSLAASSFSEASSTPSRADISKIRIAVNASLDRSAELLGALSGKLASSTSVAARDEYARVAALASQGNDLEAQGDDSRALSAYQDSLSTAARLEIFARAAAAYHVDVFSASGEGTSSSSRGENHASRARVPDSYTRTRNPATSTPAATTHSATSSSVSTSSATTNASSAPSLIVSPPAIPAPAPSSSQTQDSDAPSVLGVPVPVPASVPPVPKVTL